MIESVVFVVESGEVPPFPEIPILPRNIASGLKPNKEDEGVIKNHYLHIFYLKNMPCSFKQYTYSLRSLLENRCSET